MRLTKKSAKIYLIVAICALVVALFLLVYEFKKEFVIELENRIFLSPEEASVERTIVLNTEDPTLSEVTLKIISSEKAIIVREIIPDGSVLYPSNTQTNYLVFSFKQSNNSWFIADSEPLSNLEIKYITNSSSAISDRTQISYVNVSGSVISGMAQITTLGTGNGGNTGTGSNPGGGSSGGGGGGGGGGGSPASRVNTSNNLSDGIVNEVSNVNNEIKTAQGEVSSLPRESNLVFNSKIISLLVISIVLIIFIIMLSVKLKRGLK